MSESFDPYYKWLAIPPEEQPPNFYRLLGVKTFELDPDVIESAADQRMIHLRNFQSGKHAALSQKLLNEVSAAKVTLLAADRRPAYDEHLRRQMAERPLPAPGGSPRPLPVAAPLTAQPGPPYPANVPPGAVPSASMPLGPVPPPGILPGQASASGVPTSAAPTVPVGAVPVTPPGQAPVVVAPSSSPSLTTRRRKSSNWMLPTLIAGGATAGLAMLMLCAGGLYWLSGGGSGGDGGGGRTNVAQIHPSPNPSPNPRRLGGVQGEASGTPTAAGDGDVDQGEGSSEDGSGGNSVSPAPSESTNPATPVVPPETVNPPNPAPDPSPKPPVERVSPSPPLPVTPPVPPKPKKLALPSSEEQTALLAKVNEVLGLAEVTTDDARLEKSREMIGLAEKSEAPGERFALLRRAMELARDAGDATLLLRAIDIMQAAYDVDGLNVRGTMLLQLSKHARSDKSVKDLVAASETFFDDAIAAERLDLAQKLADELVVQLIRTQAGKAYRKQLNDRRGEIRAMYAAWKKVEDARHNLAANADDPAANLVLGNYLCLTKGEFDEGVEHLSKANDEKLEEAVAKDIAARSGDNSARLAAGDAWWDLVEKQSGDDRFLARAHHWYMLAQDGLGVLDQKRVAERLASIAKVESAQRLIAAAGSDDGGAPMRVVAENPTPLRAANRGDVKLAYAPDGMTLYTGDDDGTIKLWDVNQGLLTQTFLGHKGRVNDLAVGPDGQLVSVGSDKGVFLWNEKGEHAVMYTSNRSDFRCAEFNPDGLLALVRNEDISFWDLRKRKVLRQVPIRGIRIDSLLFSPTDKMMATLGSKLVLWGPTGPMPQIDPQQDRTSVAAFSPDGKLLAMAPIGEKLRLYDLAAKTSRECDAQSVGAIAFSPDGKTLASASYNKLALWDVASGQPWSSVSTHFIRTMKFAPDGSTLATADNQGEVKLWHIKRERILAPPPPVAALASSDAEGAQWQSRGEFSFSGGAQDVAFSADSSRFAVASGQTGHVYSAEHGGAVATLSGHEGRIQSLAFAPGAKLLATGSDDRTARIWELDARQSSGVERGRAQQLQPVKTVGFSRDGTLLLIASGDGLQTADVATSSVKQRFDLGSGASVQGAAVSAGGGTFAAAVASFGKLQINVYDFGSDAPRKTLPDRSILAVDATGRRVLSSSSFSVNVVDIESSRNVTSIRANGVRCGAFHPGGRMVALGYYDRAVRLFNAETGQEIAALAGHGRGVTSIAFSPDGRSLASASEEGKVIIWSPKAAE